MRKVTLTLDDATLKRLERLARPRAGNKSFVVREAVRLMAEGEAFEDRLADLEGQRDFQQSMTRALRDVRVGRVLPHREVEQFIRTKPGR